MRLSWYRHFCYRLFRWVDYTPRTGTASKLYRAGIRMPPGMYYGLIAVTSILAAASSLVGSYLVFAYVLKSPLWFVLVAAITGSATLVSLIALPLIVSNRITSARVKINRTLPFALAYMATLSSAGMNPVEVIKHVALRDFGAISKEFGKIVYRFEVIGEDVITAINHVANTNPSPLLHDVLLGVSNIIFSGGSLREYCEQESKNLFELRKAKLKGFIDSLAIFSELYLGFVTVPIIMILIGLVLIGALGIKVLFFTTQNLFDIFVFFAVPFLNVLLLVMLELKFSSGEY